MKRFVVETLPNIFDNGHLKVFKRALSNNLIQEYRDNLLSISRVRKKFSSFEFCNIHLIRVETILISIHWDKNCIY